MKSMISLILAAGIVEAGFAERRQGNRVIQEDFTQRLMHAEQSLDVADGELCIRIYHEIWKTGYHLTKEDKANIEQAFTICKGDYKKILEHAKRDRRYNEEEARARWQKILGYYTDLTRKTIRLSIAYMAIGEQDIQKFGNSQEKVDGSGNLIESSAYNVALHGINFLGYGVDEEGDPKNIACIIKEMGNILQNCDENGYFQEGDREDFMRLFGKFESAAHILEQKHTEMDTEAAFLKDNQKQLETRAYTLQEQFLGMEDVDLADAITAYSWAQYSYNAALKVGNSILSESLMDYLKT